MAGTPQDTDANERKSKTLVVGAWSSECGNCGKGANPSEKSHDSVLGYSVPDDEVGCGVTWEFIVSSYCGPGVEEAVRAMRPDLEYNSKGLVVLW